MKTIRVRSWPLGMAALAGIAVLTGCSPEASGETAGEGPPAVELLNVSYDPTRELY